MDYFVNRDDLGRITYTEVWDRHFVFWLHGQAYSYNDANQRKLVETDMAYYTAGPSDWEYQYDFLGQINGAFRFWWDDSPVEGQRWFEYDYDDIGNRVQTIVNGRDPASYTLDPVGSEGLNQYREREVPDVLDILGMAHPDATVEITAEGVTEPADHRKEGYFHHELGVDNETEYWYEEVTVTEDLNGTVETVEEGYLFAAEDPEKFVYDADGNLIEDGRWEYTWDAENRLRRMEETRSANVGEPWPVRLTFAYDYRGRRIEKFVEVKSPSTGVWEPLGARYFVYSGWNLIGELNESKSLVRSYLWGLDLAEQGGALGSQHGNGVSQLAGGVGGLRLITDHTSDDVYFAYHDANGNVIGLVDADSDASQPAAEYEYDPFGNLIRASGEAAEVNPFRFSTKYEDPESGMYYYGMRFYDPGQGRFLNRDPIEEQGGLNVYGFVGNDPVNGVDHYGLSAQDDGGRIKPPSPLDIAQCLAEGIGQSYLNLVSKNFADKLNNINICTQIEMACTGGDDRVLGETIDIGESRMLRDVLGCLIKAGISEQVPFPIPGLDDAIDTSGPEFNLRVEAEISYSCVDQTREVNWFAFTRVSGALNGKSFSRTIELVDQDVCPTRTWQICCCCP